MATITASAAYSGVQPRAGLGVCSVKGTIALTSITANDVVQMVKIPKGATVIDVKLSGVGVASTIVATADVGDGNDVDRYIDGVSASGNMATSSIGGVGGGYEYSADDTIDILFPAVSSGSGTAGLTVQVLYTMDA